LFIKKTNDTRVSKSTAPSAIVLKARDEHLIGGIFAAKVEAHEGRVEEEWVHLRILIHL
jgi:hypothetical protein